MAWRNCFPSIPYRTEKASRIFFQKRKSENFPTRPGIVGYSVTMERKRKPEPVIEVSPQEIAEGVALIEYLSDNGRSDGVEIFIHTMRFLVANPCGVAVS